MIGRLRTLERALACQRAQVILAPIAESFADTWQQALADGAEPQDGLDLLRAVTTAGVRPLAPGPVISYLDHCRRGQDPPDPDRLVMALVHGFGASRFARNAHCRCLARCPLHTHPSATPV